ncbi:MAG: hypothetical protein H6841_04205 [Planctomycetes bacterium]|nr:hypothetical protein [Planctomycetota bacterium]MCB9934579.1 hypothetical protein [Planctomycetota bacterium]
MSRLIAACFVVLLAVAMTGAQPAPKESSIKAVLGSDGTWSWTLPADGSIQVTELLGLYGRCRQLTLIIDEKKLAGNVSFLAVEGTELKGDEIDFFVANSLSDYRLCLMDVGAGQVKVVPAVEAPTLAPIIKEDALETAAGWQWVTLVYAPAHADENALRGALQNLTTRQGGMINPVQGGGLLICDRADRVREMHKAARELDANIATEIKAHDVPVGVNADDAVKALRELFGQSRKFAMNPPTFTRATGEARVIIRGSAGLHAEAAEALKAMK